MKNELQNYVDGIRADIVSLYNSNYTEEEAEEMRENGDFPTLYDYFMDVLDIEYTISGSGEYLGVRLAVTLGGPNVWVDTRRGEVFGAWGTDRATAWIPSEICEEIDGIFSEYYSCIR